MSKSQSLSLKIDTFMYLWTCLETRSPQLSPISSPIHAHAPRESNNDTTSVCPCMQAMCNGVLHTSSSWLAMALMMAAVECPSLGRQFGEGHQAKLGASLQRSWIQYHVTTTHIETNDCEAGCSVPKEFSLDFWLC